MIDPPLQVLPNKHKIARSTLSTDTRFTHILMRSFLRCSSFSSAKDRAVDGPIQTPILVKSGDSGVTWPARPHRSPLEQVNEKFDHRRTALIDHLPVDGIVARNRPLGDSHFGANPFSCQGAYRDNTIYDGDYNWPSLSEVSRGDEWKQTGNCGLWGGNC